jgi:hypothetical protein
MAKLDIALEETDIPFYDDPGNRLTLLTLIATQE